MSRTIEFEEWRGAFGLSLIYVAGERPTGEAAQRILRESGSASVGHNSGGGDTLLTLGSSLHLTGLEPSEPADLPRARHFFGLADTLHAFPFEAITLERAPDATGKAAVVPLVQEMVRAAAALAAGSPARALFWQPAGTCMEPGYFARLAGSWLAGGAFPALGLTPVVREADGSVVSDGLKFFIGQELHVAPRAGEHATETVKLAVRTVDVLVREGPLTRAFMFRGPADEALRAEPSADGRIIHLRREG